jgi:hypothetical protein
MKEIPVIFSRKTPGFHDLKASGEFILKDWAGKKIPRPVKFLFRIDDTHFHFLVRDENGPGLSHPDSEPSQYQPALWKYDVAEFFLMSADRSRYLEFNLAPNGAWWSSSFTKPRVSAPGEPSPIPDVATSAERTDHFWQASARIPLFWLHAHYGFGKKCLLNATFILKSPGQIFLTAGDLGKGEPDFHRPDRFPTIKVTSLA